MLKFKAILGAAFFLTLAAPAGATQWPQSDVPLDPALTLGVLPNGMRYAIMHNATPAGSVSVRLRIDAGSLQETDGQRGLAHFLEHMAFRGSANVADGEINKQLERLGLRFGADTNASTEQDQTVYQFDLPKSDDQTVDTVLGYTREIASNLTLDPAAAKTEAGVVLSELKLRDSPALRVLQAQLDFALRDPHATALPSGDPAIIAQAPVAQLRAFYQAYYRPERTTLVIVGDIDPAQVANKIKARFSDWTGVGAAGKDPRMNIPLSQSTMDAKLFVEPDAPAEISLLWKAPPDVKPDDLARERASLIDSVALQILNRRLQAAAADTAPPFTNAAATRDQILQAVSLVTLSIGFEPGQWQGALAAAEKIRLGAMQSGVTQAEVDRAIADLHTSFQSRSAGAATRPSRRIMNDVLSEVSSNDVYTSPQRDLTASDQDLKGLTVGEVNTALRRVFSNGAQPSIFVSSSKTIAGGEQAIKTALLDVEKTPVASLPGAVAQNAQTTWPYVSFGKPGTVAQTKSIADVGATSVTFTNGVHLTVRPSKVRSNQVLVSVKVGGGRLDLPRDRDTVAWAAGAIISGGLKAMSYADMQRILATKTYRTGFSVGEDGFVFAGSTSPQDIDTQLQVITAYLQEPGFRPEALEQVKSRYAERLRQSDASPGAILQLQAPELLHDGDKRWATPSAQEVQDANMDDLKNLLTPVFANGALDVTIVGDITPEQAIRAVAATFGALPERAKARSTVTKQNDTHLPAEGVTPIDLTRNHQATQVISSVVWPTHGQAADIRDDATLQLMSAIMQERLFDKLRGQGVAYEAQVEANASRVFDYGYVQALAQLSPDKAAQFYDALDQSIADLEAGKITADDLDRARNPAIEEFQKNQQTNEYWLAVLDGTQENPHALDMARTYEAALRQVTLSDIEAAAQKYLTKPHMIRLTSAS